MEIKAMEVFWLMLAAAAVFGVLMLLSAVVTGYLVFRTKRDSHEPLIAPKVPNAPGGPYNIDEFAWPEGEDEGEVLPEVIKEMNKRINTMIATEKPHG